MEDKSDEEVQEAALQVLRNIYGQAVQQPVACAVTRWAQDPFSKGDFIYVSSVPCFVATQCCHALLPRSSATLFWPCFAAMLCSHALLPCFAVRQAAMCTTLSDADGSVVQQDTQLRCLVMISENKDRR